MRVTGPERAALVQAIQATGAAVLAWVVASRIFDFSQPFLAPWSAIFIVEATVYRSVRSAAQQVSAVTVAVVLTTAVAAVIPWELLTLTVAVLAGLLIGQWHRFGESGPWIGITALLLLTSGAMAESLLVERLVETVLGAGIGLVINATIFPPVYGDAARGATSTLADELASLLATGHRATRERATAASRRVGTTGQSCDRAGPPGRTRRGIERREPPTQPPPARCPAGYGHRGRGMGVHQPAQRLALRRGDRASGAYGDRAPTSLRLS
ncbi:aromatic acid exporter family protein [Rhodococcus sp. NPDC056960]|uniref:FUSC family protein n=1 Tax=Rhodococcus sp. NPDC056960 TaxID=3345982 RepID=UPI0036307354